MGVYAISESAYPMRMKARTWVGLSCALGLAAAIVDEPNTAQAQIVVGFYDLWIGPGDGGTGRPDLIGHIHVPEHGNALEPYHEHWLLLGDYGEDIAGGAVVSIVPSNTSPEDARAELDRAAAAPGVIYRHVLAQRNDLEVREELQDTASSFMNPCELEAEADEANFFTVWQRSSTEGSASNLVGFVRRLHGGFHEGREQWCVSDDYIYPTPGNAVITELRAAQRQDLAEIAASVLTPAGGGVWGHGIDVVLHDFEASDVWQLIREDLWREPPAAAVSSRGCGVGRLGASHYELFALSFLGVVLARRRRARVPR